MQLSLNRYFMDDRWSRGRVVTAMDWSAQFPELVVASYSAKGSMDVGGSTGSGGNDPDGVALVWNSRYVRFSRVYAFVPSRPMTCAPREPADSSEQRPSTRSTVSLPS